jgi:hypothetical protein
MKRGGPLRRYKALQGKTPLRRSGWIKRKAPKEKQRAELEASKRIIWERPGGRCEFYAAWTRIPMSRCVDQAQDPHHISRQSQGHDHSPRTCSPSAGFITAGYTTTWKRPAPSATSPLRSGASDEAPPLPVLR